MIRLLLFALLFAMPAAADDVFMNNTTSESNMCVIDVTGQTASTPSVVAHANWSPITYNCAAGTYLPADGVECATCTVGNYCIGGNYTYNETTTQGLTACAANYTSSAGAYMCSPMMYNINYVINGGNILPAEYTQVEYLQSSGTQYIDTGIIASGTNYEYSVTFIPRGALASVIGNQYEDFLTYTMGNYLKLYPSNVDMTAFAWDFGGFMTPDIPLTINIKYDGNNVFAMRDNAPVFVHKFNENNHPENTTGIVNPTHTVLLFANRFDAYRGYGLVDMGTVAIKSARIWNNGSLVRDFIPARRNGDSVLGMYDMVSGNFFTNAGTGVFSAGADTTTVPTNAYKYGTGATVNATPTRSHSSFVGWCTDAALTNCAATQTIGTTATGDKTFYAKYLCDTGYSTNVSNTACDANTITVNWDNGAGGATQNTCTYGGDLTTPTTAPTKRGHVFTGWTFNVN